MTTWALAREAIRTFIRDASGVTDERVSWDDAGGASVFRAYPRVRLSPQRQRSIGRPLEVPPIVNANTGAVTFQMDSVDVIGINVAIENERAAAGENPGMFYAAKLRKRAFASVIRARLRAAQIGLWTIGDFVAVPVEVDERELLVYAAEFTFQVSAPEVLEELAASGWFNRAEPLTDVPPMS